MQVSPLLRSNLLEISSKYSYMHLSSYFPVAAAWCCMHLKCLYLLLTFFVPTTIIFDFGLGATKRDFTGNCSSYYMRPNSNRYSSGDLVYPNTVSMRCEVMPRQLCNSGSFSLFQT